VRAERVSRQKVCRRGTGDEEGCQPLQGCSSEGRREGGRTAASGTFRVVFFSAFVRRLTHFSLFSALFRSCSRERGDREEQHRISASFPRCSPHVLHRADGKRHWDAAQDLLLLSSLSLFLIPESQSLAAPLSLLLYLITCFVQVTYKGKGLNSRVFHILALTLQR